MKSIVDGKQINQRLKENLTQQVLELDRSLSLSVVYVGHDPVIETFVELKRTFAQAIGVEFAVEQLPEKASELTVIETVKAQSETNDGVVVQLPLPAHIDRSVVLNTLEPSQDPDVLSDKAYEAFKQGEHVLPPVAGAVAEIVKEFEIDLSGMSVAVVGYGRLVGAPVAVWFEQQGVKPMVLEKGDGLEKLKDIDMVISGTGVGHMITPEFVKQGAVLIDAGTSESEGGVQGDIHPDCAQKASVFSPVPGGVGPITVAKLFENLVQIATLEGSS